MTLTRFPVQNAELRNFCNLDIFPRLTFQRYLSTSFEWALRRDDPSSDGTLQRQQPRGLGRIGRILSIRKIERLDLAPLEDSDTHGGGGTCYEVTRALSKAFSPLHPLMETRPCLVLRTGGCSRLLGFFLLDSALPRCHPPPVDRRSNLDPIAGSTTISILLVTKPAIYGGDLLPYL